MEDKNSQTGSAARPIRKESAASAPSQTENSQDRAAPQTASTTAVANTAPGADWVGELQTSAQTMNSSIETFLKEHSMAAVLVAAGVGLAASLIVQRLKTPVERASNERH